MIYYIGPTVWAWRRGRIASVRERVDLMLTILPFEEEIYRDAGVRSLYVGNPLVDAAPPREGSDLRESIGLARSGHCVTELRSGKQIHARTSGIGPGHVRGSPPSRSRRPQWWPNCPGISDQGTQMWTRRVMDSQ